MNLNLYAIALLLFSALGCVQCRALLDTEDNNDVDNSIETEEQQPRSRLIDSDWLKFTKAPPLKVLQTVGSTVEIVCEVMGSQVPTIQWTFGNLPITELESLESNAVSEIAPSAIVRVRSVHIIDHMLSEPRTYTCVGNTGSKTIYASTVVYPQADIKELLHTHEKPYPGLRRPRIIYSEKMHLDLVGSNVLLPCKAHPRADIFWMNNEEKIVGPGQRLKVLPTGHLLIPNIKWEDMGGYKCIARNSVGKDTADTFVYPVLKEKK